jgi:alpha-L-rhamnosidase
MNHIMFGEISAWFYKALGGIRPDPKQPGFKNILLEPHFVNGLNNFEASHQGPYGIILSKWVKSKEKIDYFVTVPANSCATLTLPQQIVKEGNQPVESNQLINTIATDKTSLKLSLLAGSYHFTFKLNKK